MHLPPVRVPHPHVVCELSVMQGSPLVAGTKVPVRRLWSWHRKGVAVETLLKRYRIWTVAIDYANVRGVRISPNVYTTTEELDVLVKALKELAAGA